VHLLVCYLNKLQNARWNDKDTQDSFHRLKKKKKKKKYFFCKKKLNYPERRAVEILVGSAEIYAVKGNLQLKRCHMNKIFLYL